MAHECRSLSVLLGTGALGGPKEERTVLEVNASEGIPFESPGFKGKVLLLNRPDPEPANWPYSKHFEGKARRFEFRLQGVFTEEPGNNIFFGVEMTEVVGLSTALRVTANWILSVVSLLCSARGITYSYNLELEDLASGDLVRPYLAFPVVAADAIVVTPPEQVPPSLTQAIDSVPLEEKKRISFNTRDTYTFAYWSKQADFERWEMCNMPFGWSSSFSHFIGQQSVHLTAYRLVGGSPDGPHSEARKKRLMSLSLSNSRARANGKARQAQRQESQSHTSRSPRPAQGWSLEAAELSPDDFQRVWLDEAEVWAMQKPTPGLDHDPRPSWTQSWSSILTVGMCTCTHSRHGLR